MLKAIPKRTFLIRKDVIAHKGIAIEVTAQELKRFKSDLIQIKK